MPAIGVSGHLHTSMGTGALVPTGLERAAFKKALKSPDPNLNGPIMDVVRPKRGVSAAAGRRSLQRIVMAADRIMAADPNGAGDTYAVLSVQRPAEIMNYQSTGATPAVLAAGLAAGAVVALGLTLGASVRRRRHDLALLKTFGFITPTGRRRGLAGVGGRCHRNRPWHTARQHLGSVTVDPVRPRHLRRPVTVGSGGPSRARGLRHSLPGDSGLDHPRSHRRTHPHRAGAAIRVKAIPSRWSRGRTQIPSWHGPTIRSGTYEPGRPR